MPPKDTGMHSNLSLQLGAEATTRYCVCGAGAIRPTTGDRRGSASVVVALPRRPRPIVRPSTSGKRLLHQMLGQTIDTHESRGQARGPPMALAIGAWHHVRPGR